MNEYDFGSRHRAQKRKVHWNSENKIRYFWSDDLFAVVRGSSTARVCGEFLEFGSSLVRLVWHGVPPRGVTSSPYDCFIFKSAQL